MQKETIGFVIPNLEIGGNQKSVANLSRMLSSRYNILLILFDAKMILNCYNGKIIDLKSQPRKTFIGKIYNSFSRIIKLKIAIRSEKIRLLYFFLNPENVLNYIGYKGCKKIISCRDFGSLKKSILKFKLQLKKSDLMICNSNYIKEYYVSKYPKDKSKVRVIHNFADEKLLNRYLKEPVEKEFLDFISSHYAIIAVGRMCKEKGFQHLLKAFEILNMSSTVNVKLIIIGDGTLYPEIASMVRKSKYPDKIMLLGYKSNPYKYMKRCDLFALSSISEGFPNVILEAMNCGLPVISTNCKSGPSEILNEQYNYDLEINEACWGDYGVLTPPFKMDNDFSYDTFDREHYIFADVLREMLENESLLEKYKQASLKRSKDFSAQKTLDDYDKLLMKLLK